MEPVTLGIMAVLALFFVIVALAAFRMLTKETNFEDVYGENAMRLFAEEKSGKQKTTKGNKNKGRNNDKKKDNSADKEQKRAEREKHHEKKTEGSSTEVAKPLETMSDSEPGRNGEAVSLQEMKHTKKKNRNKHQQEENKIVEAMQSEKENDALQGLENTEPLMVQTPRQPEAVVESIPLIDEIAVAEGMEKKGKKKRARRSEDHIREVTKEEVQPLKNESKLEDLLPPQTVKEEKRVEKPRPKKAAVSVQDITTDKLHARLSAIEDLEAEYLSFLATYFSDTSMQKTKLSEENALLRKQIADKERLVLQCTDKLSAAQKKDADIAHLQQSLSEEKKKYTLFEQSVCTQLSASVKDKNYLQHLNEQLRSEASNLKEELKKTQAALKAVPPPVDTTAFQQQADMLRSELNTAKKKASQLESELSQRTQALQQMKSDLQGHEIQMEHLKQASAVSEKRFKEAEAASKMEREFLEAKLNDTLKAMEELQTLVNTAREEAQKRAVSAQSAVQDCKNEFAHQLESLKHQLAKVEKERDMLKVDNERSFATFSQKDVQHKNELMKLNDEIVELRRMAEDERSKFSSEIDEKTGEVAELRKQANELHKQCEQESALLSTFREKLREAEQAANLDRTKVSRLEKELAEAKAHLDAKEAANDAQLKCAHCAARIVMTNGDACEVRDDPGDTVTVPEVTGRSPHGSVVHRDLVDECIQISSQPQPYRETTSQHVASEPKVHAVTFTADGRGTISPQNFAAVALNEGESEEENVEWTAIHSREHSLMCLELKWAVNDWDGGDVPKEVGVSGSFWDWQPPHPMHRYEDGYRLRVELPAVYDEHDNEVEVEMLEVKGGARPLKSYSRSDSGHASPSENAQQVHYHEFKFFVDGQWRCAEQYEKRRTDDGYENNVIYF
uniref:5'-AMP-activated protein kinase subunit beta-1 n=1 Tax=Parascaris univalens TaxID=6257 RepID=A0A915B422_PARUN